MSSATKNSSDIFSHIYSIKHNHLMCVVDTAKDSGKFILREYIRSLTDSEIHIFCYDCSSEDLSKEFSLNDTSVIFYDCLPEINNEMQGPDKLSQFISSIKTFQCSSKNLVIVIDSLSTILLENSIQSVYRMLHYLTLSQEKLGVKFRIQTVLVLHKDSILNANYIIKHLKQICRIWFQVQKDLFHFYKKKTTGKVTHNVYEYKFVSKYLAQIQKKRTSRHKMENNDSLPVSTFRLSLNETERKARDAVKLPYERQEISGKAEIFYEPDEFDDWDEEDPDNDLEFS